jgi:hypothetical protein
LLSPSWQFVYLEVLFRLDQGEILVERTHGASPRVVAGLQARLFE